mgnify:CR=1 FL=1
MQLNIALFSIITLLNPKQEKLVSWVSLINQTLASLIPLRLGSIVISIEIARSLFEIFKLFSTGPTIGVGVGVGVGSGVAVGVGAGVGVGVGVVETGVAVGLAGIGVEVVSGLGAGVTLGAFVGVGTATVSVFDADSVVVAVSNLLVELVIEFEVVLSIIKSGFS